MAGVLLAFNDNSIWLRGFIDDAARTFINDASVTFTVAGKASGETGTITGATNASPIVITSVAHGLSNGDEVVIVEVLGNRGANTTATVANKTADTFELSGVAGTGAYTSGGTWYKALTNAAGVAMTYQAGSNGDYVGTVDGSTVDLVAGTTYRVVVRASNYNDEWEGDMTASKRTF